MFKILRFAVVHNKIIFSNSWDSIFFKNNSNLSLKMSQKSIMSFFARASSKPASVTPTKEEKIVENEDSCSPIKVKNSKRLRIESDSDSDSPPDKRPSIGNGQIKSEILATDVSKEDKDNLVEMPEENLSEVNIKTETQASPKSDGKIDCEQNQASPSSETNKKDEKSPKGKKKEENTPKNKKKEEKTPKSKKKEEKTPKSKNKEEKPPKSKKKEEKTPKIINNEEITPKSKKNEKTIKSEKDSLIAKEENESIDDSKNDKQNEENISTEEKENSKQQSKPPSGKGINSFFTSKTTAKKEDVKTGSVYDPSKLKYHPIEDAVWSRGEKVPYLALARTLEEIEKISARLRIVELLSNFFRSVIILSPNDLLPSVYLCLNKLAPAYENVELGIAETTLMKAIAQTTGRSMAQIKNDCNSTGDIGLVAEQSKSNQRMMFQPAPLTVKGVFDKLKDIAQMSGQASMAKKVDKIQSMFVACRFSEARFLIRSLAGKLRIGLAEQSVLQALAQACTTTPPLLTQQDDSESWPPKILNTSKGMSAEQFKGVVDEQALILKTIYCECPNYNMIIPILLEHGIKGLPEHCRLTPGIPLKPMLAHPTKGVQEVLQRFENVEFTCEWKYDGERAQIHVPSIEKDGQVTYNINKASIYSRNQENNTTKYPDIINRLEKTLKDTVTSCILDCEAVAWDKEKKTIMPFQVLSTRKKKDANESEIKVAVCIFMFDLLYLNGESLVKKPFEERRRLLRDHFKTVEGEWHMATSLDCSTIESIQEFLEESVKGNCEGLMVKTLNGKDATYEIAKRSRNWLKLKKDYLEGVGDTIDAVVIGGYLGRGKRTGVYGGFLLACYDKDTDEYQTLCKIGTGFSDQDLQEHSKSLAEHVIPNPKSYYRYDSSLEPDHWFDAVKVWEVKCADLSLSPIHRAAMGAVDPDKGISLRFPRFIRIRDDKTAENATSARQIAELYCNQDQVKNQASSNPKNIEEDFY